jgi:hypothetical protein
MLLMAGLKWEEMSPRKKIAIMSQRAANAESTSATT